MTTYYLNKCLPAFGYDFHYRSLSVQGMRKGMVAEIFIIYLMYLAIIIIGTIKNKYRESGNYHDGKQGDGQNPEKQNQLALVEKMNYYVFDRFFYPYFGFHTISVGMAMLYSPYDYAIIITWIHFLFYVAMIGLKIKFGEEKNKLIFALYACCQVINLSLILAGLISLGAEKDCNNLSKDL